MDYTNLLEAPGRFHFWAGVSTVAGALRKRVWLDQRRFQWVPNFYILLIGPPGVVNKTTTIDTATDLLHEVPGIHFGADATSWQSLVSEMEENIEAVEIGDRVHKMSCLTISLSEFGTFLDPEDRAQMDALVALWDGRKTPFRKSTKTQGRETIPSPWINIIAGTTPAWMRRNFTLDLLDGGLGSRIVFLFASQKRHYRAFLDSTTPSQEDEMLRESLILDLRDIASLKGEYHLSPEARSFGEVWYESHWRDRPAYLASERFDGYYGRKQTHIMKLAMILSAARRSSLLITLEDIMAAEKIITSIEVGMQKVFKIVGASEEGRHILNIVQEVKALGQVEFKDLYRRFLKDVRGPEELAAMIKGAVNAGYLQWVGPGTLEYCKDKEEENDGEENREN